MKFLFLIILITLTASQGIFAQSLLRKYPVRPEPVICYASPEVRKSFVPPPPEFLFRNKSAGHGADIVVTYIGFPDSVRVAFEYAVSIWESMISSSVPIYIEARWLVLGSNVLGSCGPGDFLRNFEDAPLKNVYYPIALAEKLQQRQITGPGSPDMIARFNSTIPWYTGTDGNTPLKMYDFVSTVLHEIAHGLGFTGFFSVNASRLLGSSGPGNKTPAAFDTYVQDFQRRYLTDEFFYPNPSEALYNAFISNQLYSASYLGIRWNNLVRPRLYAPTKFNEGSSIYHLNTATYPFGDANSLMTHQAGSGQAIHAPGPLALGILYDLGWKHLFFNLLPMKDREKITEPIRFIAAVDSELGLDTTSLVLIYSTDGFISTRDTVGFVYLPAENSFRAEVLPAVATQIISYYLAAEDSTGRDFTYPASYPDSFFTMRIGKDTIKPSIIHHPPVYLLSVEKSFLLEATISDNAGIDSAVVVIFQGGTASARIPLVNMGNDRYQTIINFSDYGLQDGGVLEYRITAFDIAENTNRTDAPSDSTLFSVIIEKIAQPAMGYFTDFNGSAEDFIQGDFRITTVKNFDNPALFSPNPYPSPESDDASFNLTAMLRVPIIVQDQGKVSFDEVVLVEPGENGTVFGDDEFWDYVIIEASRDSGRNWLPLLDGYDSGASSTWRTLYNSSISGQNSTAEGTRDHFINREFTLTGNGNFKAGDTILIRFRLFSDPYANGWGWVIDNLRIQKPVSVNFVPEISPGHIQFWPNPFSRELNWSYSGDKPVGELEFELFDLAGRLIRTIRTGSVYPGMTSTISTADIPPGICIISVKADQIPVTRLKLIKY
jgi:hypothetical protein